jgi:hypothetical protein
MLSMGDVLTVDEDGTVRNDAGSEIFALIPMEMTELSAYDRPTNKTGPRCANSRPPDHKE